MTTLVVMLLLIPLCNISAVDSANIKSQECKTNCEKKGYVNVVGTECLTSECEDVWCSSKGAIWEAQMEYIWSKFASDEYYNACYKIHFEYKESNSATCNNGNGICFCAEQTVPDRSCSACDVRTGICSKGYVKECETNLGGSCKQKTWNSDSPSNSCPEPSVNEDKGASDCPSGQTCCLSNSSSTNNSNDDNDTNTKNYGDSDADDDNLGNDTSSSDSSTSGNNNTDSTTISSASTSTNSSNVSLEFGPVLGETTLGAFLENVLGHLQGVVAFLAVLFIVIGGVIYALSSGNPAMAKAAKICWVFALVGIAIAASGPSFLKEIKEIVVPNGFPQTLDDALTLKEIVMNTLEFLLSIVGILAIIGLVVSGAMFILVTGDKSKVDYAKRAMTYSIIGIALAGASLALVKQITELITSK